MDDLIQVPVNKESTKNLFQKGWDYLRGRNPEEESRSQFYKISPCLFVQLIDFGKSFPFKDKVLFYTGLLRGFFKSSTRLDDIVWHWNKLSIEENHCKKV